MSKIKASELLDYSLIQLHTPLGGLYEVTATTYVERDLVTIWTTRDDGTSDQTLACTPDTLIELVEAPNLTLYGRIQNLLKRWERTLEDTAGDDQYIAAAELCSDLKEILNTHKEG